MVFPVPHLRVLLQTGKNLEFYSTYWLTLFFSVRKNTGM